MEMLMMMFAEATPFAGNWTVAIAALGSALGVGFIGAKGVEAIGRNPGAFTNILIFGLLGMAFAEGLAILVFFVVK